MPAGRKKVATDTSVRPPRRSRSERQRRTILRNFSSTNFRTASKTALPALPPSHTADIVPFATAPTILLRCYLALRALKRGVEVSQSGELREHPVYRQDAGQQRMGRIRYSTSVSGHFGNRLRIRVDGPRTYGKGPPALTGGPNCAHSLQQGGLKIRCIPNSSTRGEPRPNAPVPLPTRKD